MRLGNLDLLSAFRGNGLPIAFAIALCAPTLLLGQSFFSCNATSVPSVVRAEGIAERTGDILITCQEGQDVSTPTLITNLSVSINVNATNNLDFGAGVDVTDAILIVNENNCSAPAATGGVYGGCGAPSAYVQDPQFGRLAAPNRVEWHQVHFPVPGADIDGAGPSVETYPAVTTLRISSIRANVSQFGVPSIPGARITAFVSSLIGGSTLIVTNNVLNIAVAASSVAPNISYPNETPPCRPLSTGGGVTIGEAYSFAFRAIGAPDFQPGTLPQESGYFAPGSNLGAGASSGSRILLRFYNVPSGAQVSMPRIIENGNPAVTGDALRLQFVEGADSNGAGGMLSSDTSRVVLTPTAGVVHATYEVVDENPFSIEEARVGASFSSGGLPVAPATINMTAALAPVSNVAQADFVAAEPRFADTSGEPKPIVEILPCTSTMLFPFVSNQFGDDTTIVIANKAGFDGSYQTEGACTIHYHGRTADGGNAPPAETSTVVPVGGRLEFALSGGNPAQGITGAPGLRGYAIAVCEFPTDGRAVLSRGGSQVDIEAENVEFGYGQTRVVGSGQLLIPFGSTRDGFDTEVAISNTTEDTLGTAPESGACTVRYFGLNAPPPQATPTLAAGEQTTLLLSQTAPGFEGYMSLDCGFSGAHGLARIVQRPSPSVPASFEVALRAEPALIGRGVSTLLLSNVAARGGHSTWLAIANMSANGLGSTPQAGSCFVSFRGDAASPSIPDQVIALEPGQSARIRISEGLPSAGFASASDFFGWVAVFCNFPQPGAATITTEGTGVHTRAAFAQVAARYGSNIPIHNRSIFHYASNTVGLEDNLAFVASPFYYINPSASSGLCQLHFHGERAPAAVAFSMAASEHIHFPLSKGFPAKGIPPAPAFKGFVTADCNFLFEHLTDWRRKDVSPLELSHRIGVYAPDGAWRLDRSGDSAFQPDTEAAQFGFPGATPITGDWNGDGRDEIGVFANGFWYLDYDGNGQWDGGAADKQYEFGWAGVTPFVGDWNGDGRDTIGIYIDGFWFLDADGDGQWDGPGVDIAANFGFVGVTPLVGDWNADGRDNIGIYIDGFWYLDYDGSGQWDGPTVDRQSHFGFAGATPVTGDWNADGRAKMGLFFNGFWYQDYNGNGVWEGPDPDRQAEFGFAGATPQIGDWQGDGADDIAVTLNGFWYIDADGDRTWDQGLVDQVVSFGQAGDVPAIGRW